MVSDKEYVPKNEAVHIIMALRRKKENRDVKELCFRQIVRDETTDLNILKERIKNIVGVWRIYHTVNRRDTAKAMKLLMKHLIDHPEDAYRIDSVWKTCLMKPTSKYEKKFLIDIDTEDKVIIGDIRSILKKNNVKVLKSSKTPNGVHIVTEKFDTRMIESFRPIVELHRDRYYFMDRLVIEKEKGERNEGNT